MKTLGVIDVACDLQTASQKVATRLAGRLGGRPLLTWMIRRVTEAERLDRVVAVFAKAEAQKFGLTEFVPNDVEAFVFDSNDPLQRILATLQAFPHDAVVRIGMDSPFVDPNLIDTLVESAQRGPTVDYASYQQRDGNPAIFSNVGLFCEWCSADALHRVDRLVSHPDERRQLTRYFFAHAAQFQLRLIPIPDELDGDDTRLTIEATEDWELAEDIYEALGEDGFNCYNFAELLKDQTKMRIRMEALNQAERV